MPMSTSDDWDDRRERIIGLGEKSVRKSYYPELKRQLEELERFRTLLDYSNDAIFLVESPTNQIIDVNKSACDQLGCTQSEVLTCVLDTFVPAFATEQINNVLCNDKDEGTTITTQLQAKNGANVPVEIMVQRVTLGGNVYGILVARDISARLKMEEVLRKSEERYYDLFEGIPIGLYRTTPQGKLIEANSALVEMFGYPDRINLLTTNVYELYVDPNDRIRWQTLIEQEGVCRDFEVQLHRLDGTIIWVRNTSRAVYDDDGTILFYEGSLDDITERRQTEAALEESEKKHRLLFENANILFSVYDRQGICQLINHKAATLLGGKPADFIGKSFQELHPEAGDEYMNRIRRSIDLGIVQEHEDEVVFPESRLWLHSWTNPIPDAQGVFQTAQIISHDITERKQAELALRESESKLREAQQMAHIGNWRLDIKSNTVEWSEEIYNIFHLNPEEFTPQVDSIMALSPWPEDHVHIRNITQKALAKHEPGSYEQRFRHPDGSTGYYFLTFQGLYDDRDELIAIKGTLQDITERKQAELAREENEKRYKGLFEQTNDAVYIINSDGFFLSANQRGADMLGYSVRELVGQPVQMVAPASEHDHMAAVRKNLLTGETITVYERILKKKNGEEFPAEINVALVKDADGQPRHIQSVVRDITARKQAEQQRLDLALEKERGDTLRMLIGNISHDIKTPLAIINTSLYLLERLTEPEKRQGKIDNIKNQVHSLENFIQDLLALSRLDSNPIPRLTPVDVNELVLNIEAETQPMIEQKQITFTLDLGEDVTPIQADQADLRRALTNLVENALNYTPTGQAITVRTRKQADSTLVEVADTGIGIEEDELPYIFDRFYRSPQAQRISSSGSGLGLAIVQRVIEMHGGSIDVTSQPGTGTTFRIQIPLY